MGKTYVQLCSAKKCYNSRSTHPSMEFFGFPKDITLCKKWLENCGRTDLSTETVVKSKGYYRLCADHFEQKWFTDSTRSVLKRYDNPLPTIFVNNIESLLPQQVTTKESTSPIFMRKEEFEPKVIAEEVSNINPKVKVYQIKDVCRFCTNKVLENYVDMCSETEEAIEIRQICSSIMPNKVDVCDRLPQKVCQQCITDLRTCHRLMTQFENADRFLRAVANNSLSDDNETFVKTCDSSNLIRMPKKKNLVSEVSSNGFTQKANEINLHTINMEISDTHSSLDETCLLNFKRKITIPISDNQETQRDDEGIILGLSESRLCENDTENDFETETQDEVKFTYMKYKCKKCHEIFPNLHNRSIDNENPINSSSFTCSSCSKKLQMKALVEKHHTLKLKNTDILSETLGMEFDCGRDFGVSTENVLKCPICELLFYNQEIYERHITEHSKKVTCKTGELQSKFLDKVEKSRQNLVTVNDLSQCSRLESDQINVAEINRTLIVNKTNLFQKGFWCQKCYKVFTQKTTLMEHLHVHRVAKRLKCEGGKKTFGLSC